MRMDELLYRLANSDIKHDLWLPEGFDPSDGAEITRLVSDSRKAEAGTLFACVRGDHSDGHDFAEKAFSGGTAMLLCERRLDLPVPQIISTEIRRNMGRVASILYGEPSKKMKMIAVTGTNGKTTSVFMTRSILEDSGIKTGLLGTIYYDDGENSAEAEHTTPEGADLQLWLARMAKNGCSACVMETSSHAVEQGRIDGILFDRAGFTNLTVDHLDYHKDMERYYSAKKTLFKDYLADDGIASVNVDDSYGKRLYDELAERALAYGIKNRDSDFFAEIGSVSAEGIAISISAPKPWGSFEARLPMLGEYNVLNALQALSLSKSLGIDKECALEGLQSMKQVPGRLERYLIEGSGACVIDFAHSPDSLEKVLSTLKRVCKGKLIVVFGAGGDRDKTKRPIMGEIAGRVADSMIITSDNPRSEDPYRIISEIEAGAALHTTERKVVCDRKAAIIEGLEMSAPGDILLIAGRGHESHQILKDGPIPFLDRDAVLEWCARKGKEVG